MQSLALLLVSAVSAVNPLNPIGLSFAPNRGQLDAPLEWEARGRNYGLFLDGKGVTLGLRMTGPLCAQPASVRLSWVGATARPLLGMEPLGGVVNSYVGPRARWREGLPTFAKVRHASAWPGVDIVYYGTERQLEMDFVVQPGADLSKVVLEVTGAQPEISRDGALRLQAAGGVVELPAPFVYQLVDGEKRPVSARYLVRGANRVGFAVGTHDRKRPLVIDPVVAYSSYFGGSGDDFLYGAAVDAAGALYVVGVSGSNDMPLPSPSPAPPFNQNSGTVDAFVAKIGPTGDTLVYATYIGGTADDQGTGIAIDGNLNAYIVGVTSSVDFPIKQALQSTLGGGQDAFVTMLSPSGTLAYSTYLGGVGLDFGTAIAVDATGAAYVAGDTDGPFPSPSPQTPSGDDAYVTKIGPRPVDNVTAPELVFTRLVGGSDLDVGNGVAVDGSNAVYLVGYTASNDFPLCDSGPCTSPSPAPMRPGLLDGFITKITPTGDQVAYSRFLGGAGDDIAQKVAVDSSGAAYVVGLTNSNDFPTMNAFQPTYGGGAAAPLDHDAFALKLSPSGSSLVYSTYLGGSGNDEASSLALHPSGSIYIGGSTFSTNFPVTSTAVMSTLPNAGGSAFLVRLTATGSGLGWGTYFGGTTSTSSVLAIATNGSDNTWAVGFTDATDMTQENPLTTKHAGQEGFFVKLAPTAEPPVLSFITPPAAPANTNTAVTITGANFVSGATVTFDGMPCGSVVVVNAETITCTTPLHAAGTVTVEVKNPDMQADTLSFTFEAPTAPTLTAITPTSGSISGGTVVTITGSKIASAATVTFGGLAATNVAVIDSTRVTAMTPAHAAGAVDVVVSNGSGLDATLAGAFTYVLAPGDDPSITSITPNSGPTAGGTNVTILGNDFVDGATVTIGGTAATMIDVVGSTTIQAVTPAGTAGAADVVVKNSNGKSATLAAGFTYGTSNSTLSVVSVVPSSGSTAGGDRVKLLGAGFTDGAVVRFGGADATMVQLDNASQLTVTTPAHAAGAVDIEVLTSDGQRATLSGGFTYKDSGGGCDCDVSGRSSGGGMWLLLLLVFVWRYSSSSTSSVFQYDASTSPRKGSHSR